MNWRLFYFSIGSALCIFLSHSTWARAEARLVVGLNTRVASLDPFSQSGIDAYDVTSNLIEPLARIHPRTKELIPWLAESWTIDLPHQRFRVRLRKGVRFHNGELLNSQDVKFTFEAYRRLEMGGAIWRPLWEDIESVEIIDDHTLDFKMKNAHYMAFENILLLLRILPRSFYATADRDQLREKMVGSGPFILVRFQANASVALKPNPGWWGKSKPHYSLLFKSLSDPFVAQQMMDRKELDVYAIPSVFDSTQLRGVFRSTSGIGEGLWLDLNWRRSLFQNQKVRNALLILWDRVRVNEKLYHGLYHLALDGFSPKVPYYPPGRPEPFDLQRARALLRQAGWLEDKTKSGLVKDGKQFAITILVHSASAERWVSLYQADAAKVGIQVEIRRIEEDSQWWKLLKDGKFDVVAGEGGVSESAHSNTWRSDGFYNFSGYKNAEVDRLLDILEKEFDLKKRQSLQGKILNLIRGDYAQVAGLYSPTQNFLLSERVELDPVFPTQAWRYRLKDHQFSPK